MNQRGITQVLVLLILLAGLAGGLWLVQNRTNLFPRAASGPISGSNFGKAIKFNNESSNNAYVVIKPASIGFQAPTQYTLEGWVKTPKPVYGSYIRDYSLVTANKVQSPYDYGYIFRLSLETQESNGDSRPIFNVLTTNNSSKVLLNYLTIGSNSSLTLKADSWNHLAVTATSSNNTCTLVLYINGIKSFTVNQPGCQFYTQQPTDIYIARPNPSMGGISGYFYPGTIDEARFSNTIRYSGNFDPKSVGGPFLTDSYTLALYHFDGNTTDLSSYNYNTQMVGNVQFVDSNIGTSSPSPTSKPVSAPVTQPPTPSNPAGGPGVSSPITRKITQYRVAENPADLGIAAWRDYHYGLEVAYIFKDASPGPKFVFIQFRSEGALVKIGGQDYISAQIELLKPPIPTETLTPSPTASETPIPTPSPTATVTPSPAGGLPFPIPFIGGGGGGGGGGSVISTPTPTLGVGPARQFRVAENLKDLNNLTEGDWQPYTKGMEVDYEFKDPSPGLKSIYIQFRDGAKRIIKSSAGVDYSVEYIELSPESITPTPSSTPLPTPRLTDGPDCPFDNPGSYSIEKLYELCSVNQMARFDLKWLQYFKNEVLIDIGRRKGNLGEFLANFTGERLLGLDPFKPEAAFSLDILRELPSWRVKQLPGYIQDQLK